MAMKAVGRDGLAYLVADGPVGAIITPGTRPLINTLPTLRAHRKFDDFDGPVPSWAPQNLAVKLAEYRRERE